MRPFRTAVVLLAVMAIAIRADAAPTSSAETARGRRQSRRKTLSKVISQRSRRGEKKGDISHFRFCNWEMRNVPFLRPGVQYACASYRALLGEDEKGTFLILGRMSGRFGVILALVLADNFILPATADGEVGIENEHGAIQAGFGSAGVIA
jgi:hypothetical protein